MIIRSNIITRQDILDTVDAMNINVDFIYQETPDGYMISVREFTPRKFERGYEFFLAGSHHAASQHDCNHKAATWVEWGIIIDKLFQIDPNAEIGWYKGRDDFMQKTAQDYRVRRDKIEAPWLVAA